MEEVHDLLRAADRLVVGSRQDQNVVDEDHEANVHLTKAVDGRLEKLGGNARSRAETKGHGRVLELPLVEHEAK